MPFWKLFGQLYINISLSKQEVRLWPLFRMQFTQHHARILTSLVCSQANSAKELKANKDKKQNSPKVWIWFNPEKAVFVAVFGAGFKAIVAPLLVPRKASGNLATLGRFARNYHAFELFKFILKKSLGSIFLINNWCLPKHQGSGCTTMWSLSHHHTRILPN